MKKILLSWLLALIAPFSFGQSYPSPTYNNLTVVGAFTATGKVTTADLATQAANTVLANATGASSSPTAFSMPGCSSAASALTWTSGTGFACNSSINAATLGGATFAAPGPIGATTASTGAFTTMSVSGLASFTTITPTAPTALMGDNSTKLATTGFVARHAPCPSILDNGGDNTGVNDNSTAFATTAALGPSGNACVYFPPGTYAFSGSVSYTMPTNTASITVLGAGQDVTKLVWASGGGLTLNFITDANSAHVRDLTFATGTTNTGIGIFFQQTAANTSYSYNAIMSDVSNVTIRGNDGYVATDYWQYGIDDFGVSNINFIGVNILGASARGGTGIITHGDINRIPVQFNVVACNFAGLTTGFDYDAYTQGVSISASNFTNESTGIYTNGSALDQLTVTGSQFNATNIDINMNSPVLQTMIYGNLFLLQTNANGIYLNPSSSLSIVGNSFAPNPSATNTNGITFNGYNALSSVVTGNNFAQLTTGVNLTSNAKYVNVQGNTYSGDANTVINNCTTGCTVGVATQ